MTILARNKNKDVDYLLGSNYEGIHARLVEVLGERRAALFAQPQNRRTKGEHWWYAADGPRFEPFLSANDSVKDEIGDLLREQTEDVRGDILRDNELRGLGEKIFIFPDEGNLFYRDNGEGSLDLVICQWGCRRAGANSNSGPLIHIVNRPKKDHSDLTLAVEYSNGDLYAEKYLHYRYKDRNKQAKTNTEGQVPLGQVKNGDIIMVAAEEDSDFANPQKVVNTEEVAVHRIILPFYFSPRVEVVNQKGERLTNYGVEAEYNGKRTVHRSDEEGAFTLTNVMLDGTPLQLSSSDNPNIRESYTLDKTDEIITFTIKERFYVPVTLELLNDADKKVPNFDLSLVIEGRDLLATSDDEGIIQLSDVPEGSMLVVKKQGEIVTRQEFLIEEGNQQFTVRVNPPVPNLITVTLIDREDKPVPDTAIDFKTKNSLVRDVTNEDGKIILKDPPYSDGEKIKASVFLKRKEKKPKKRSTKIRFQEEQKDYVIKLKKRNWWWLLLLLLPLLLLLLLLEFDKDINVHTFESGTNTDISGASVDVGYVRHAFWKSGSGFFAADTIGRSGVSDSVGLTSFIDLNYTLYSAVFKRNTAFYVRARTNCHDAGDASDRFHKLKKGETLEVKMDAVVVPLAFQVVDAEDGLPLPNAEFVFESVYNGERRKEILSTDVNGKVVVNSLPKCGELLQAKASLYGYYPDSIAQVGIEKLASADPEERVLRLEPVRDNISFFVVNCRSGEPIPQAIVTIYVGKDRQGKPVYTNVDGKGKGGYDNLRILDSIRIEGTKPPYFKPGAWKGRGTVEDFVKLPDSLRTFCLEPEVQLIKFQDIDSITGDPLVGVRNVVTIQSGGETSVDTIYSNRNGVIELPIRLGDKFSILATHPPGYYPQRYKFQKEEADPYITGKATDRRIPLSPVMVTHTFRTVSPALRKLVENATLQVTVDGKTVPPASSGNGEFSVSGAYSSRVSIVASKTGYKTNDYTVRNIAFSILQSKIPEVTDIPMEFPPCSDEQLRSIKGKVDYIKEVDLGQTSGTFTFRYYTMEHPDLIQIYCGDRSQVAGNNPIWSNKDNLSTGDDTFVPVRIPFNCSVPIITVVVQESGDGSVSAWEYEVDCPR